MTEIPGDFAVIGAGRLGRQLLARAELCALKCRRVRGRNRHLITPGNTPMGGGVDSWDDPGAEPWPALVVVAVPDRMIVPVSILLAGEVDLTNRVVLHCSGALTADSLDACRKVGASVASWHPLQTFPHLELGPVEWVGVPCALEGDPAAVAVGSVFAQRLGMRPWEIQPSQKPAYHAAASVAGNLCHALVAAAAEVMGECGLPKTTGGLSGLESLVRGSVVAGLAPDAWGRMTGPLTRGDTTVVTDHVKVLPEALSGAYRSLVPLILQRTASDCED